MKVQAPMLGAAYYPEAWPESEIDRDIAKMKELGIRVARMGEFAWHKMEPREGVFEFDWLRDVIDRLQEAGISVVLGTPSATPPIWLEEKDPEMRTLDWEGNRFDHGGRRHCCSNNPTYRAYSARIAEKMAQEFGKHPNVIGWQIDNELSSPPWICFCKHCTDAFRKHLQAKYGTIENLNKRWNLNLFSQAYESFDQIPAPKARTWHSVHIKQEWVEFHSNSNANFIRMQADVVHRHTDAPIGTDMMPIFHQDHDKTTDCLDIIQYNHYNTEGNLWLEVFWMDYMRALKDRPFWVTETTTCWNGCNATPTDFRREGFCKANAWLPMTLGGEANMYWLWRQHWAGHEMMHGSVLYASGRPLHVWDELKQLTQEYDRCSEFLQNTRVATDVGVIVSSNADRLMTQQEVVTEDGTRSFWDGAYTNRLQRLYRPMSEMGLRCDVIPPTRDLSRYKLLFTPFMLSLEEADLQNKLTKWVHNGGVWVVGPMTDIRNDIGAHYIDRETGVLEQITGSYLVYQVPNGNERIQCCWADGADLATESWLQLFDVPTSAEVIATVTDGYPSLREKSIIFSVPYGKGTIVVLGTLPRGNDLQKLLKMIVDKSGVQPLHIDGQIAAAHRIGDELEGITATEYGGENGFIQLDGNYYDHVSGQWVNGKLPIAPYQTVVLQKADSK